MATRRKGKGKGKATRTKTRVSKAATRKKSTPGTKARTIRKTPAKTAPAGRASAGKPTAGAKRARKPAPARAPAQPVAAKPAAVIQPAQPVAAKPMPSPPEHPAVPEERIGVVTHYFSHLSVATLRLESGTLRVGDVIHIHGHTTDFTQKIESLEIDHAPVTEVGPNDDFGLKIVEHAREHDVVYKVRP
jgi:hypothetical protein